MDTATTTVQLLGAGGFGAIIGWYVYFINRYRKADVQIGDLVTVIGVIGGGAVLALFPTGSDLFGAYGIGLFVGFFTYFIALIFMVNSTENFNVDWFLDGRRKEPSGGFYIPEGTRHAGVGMSHGAGKGDGKHNPVGDD